MIHITRNLSLRDDEIEETHQRASGPGGQNVNTVSTAVRLRFDIRRSPSLKEDVKRRLEHLAGRRVTEGGILIILARNERSQEANRRAALARLIALIRAALPPPVPRHPTKPPHASIRQRRESKLQRARIKSLRQTPSSE